MVGSATLIRQIAELLEEREQRVAAAGGVVSRTDWAWRCDWRRRMDVVVEELRTLQTSRRDWQRSEVLRGMAAVERERATLDF